MGRRRKQCSPRGGSEGVQPPHPPPTCCRSFLLWPPLPMPRASGMLIVGSTVTRGRDGGFHSHGPGCRKRHSFRQGRNNKNKTLTEYFPRVWLKISPVENLECRVKPVLLTDWKASFDSNTWKWPLSCASIEVIHFPSREAPRDHLVLAPEDTVEEIKPSDDGRICTPYSIHSSRQIIFIPQRKTIQVMGYDSWAPWWPYQMTPVALRTSRFKQLPVAGYSVAVGLFLVYFHMHHLLFL